jgi:UPF0176 protein
MNFYKVLLFYKYIVVSGPEEFMNKHLQWCLENDIKGRIYISKEGINGTVSGRAADIINYEKEIRSYPEFADIIFKEDETTGQAFNKMHIRVKNEIVHSDLYGTSLQNGGKRLSPEELLNFYKKKRDFVIVDVRNRYESFIGKFKNAITPQIENFREWRKAAEQLKNYKNKTVVTYCTGGIRCEKASAFLVEQGFKDVYQLDGGIVSYTKKFPDTFWEGGIFVFDERRVLNPNDDSRLKHIAKCYFCGEPASYYINCHNLDCDKIIVCCNECKIENDYCCSEECRNSPNRRKKYYG